MNPGFILLVIAVLVFLGFLFDEIIKHNDK